MDILSSNYGTSAINRHFPAQMHYVTRLADSICFLIPNTSASFDSTISPAWINMNRIVTIISTSCSPFTPLLLRPHVLPHSRTNRRIYLHHDNFKWNNAHLVISYMYWLRYLGFAPLLLAPYVSDKPLFDVQTLSSLLLPADRDELGGDEWTCSTLAFNLHQPAGTGLHLPLWTSSLLTQTPILAWWLSYIHSLCIILSQCYLWSPWIYPSKFTSFITHCYVFSFLLSIYIARVIDIPLLWTFILRTLENNYPCIWEPGSCSPLSAFLYADNLCEPFNNPHESFYSMYWLDDGLQNSELPIYFLHYYRHIGRKSAVFTWP